jgi:2',3'-cyclic-nucleotide 2'-phosphodiesterase (5'-nucleotidase family)
MPVTLRIVSFNDVYSLENLPRLRNLVKHHAETNPADALAVILAGDFLAPSLLSSLDSGRGMVDCLNSIGITHVILGNHEDDVPVDELRKRVRELRAAWIATNVHGFEPALPPSAVIEVRGADGQVTRVGLVGVVMDDPATYRDRPFGGATLDPPNDAAQREAASLREKQGCAFVVAVTHQPMPLDRDLARAQTAGPCLDQARAEPETCRPFPVIIGGHEHVVLVELVEKTSIVKAGQDAAHAAIVELTWEPGAGAGTPAVSVRVDAVDKYPEDADLRARVEAHMAKVHALEGAALLALPPGQHLSSIGTRAGQTTMGTLVCSRLRDAVCADACVFNGGGIRGSREYTGKLTYGDIKSEMPFDNEVVVVRLPGRVVAEAVAASRARAPAESGGFLQVDDGTVVAEDNRVTHLAGAPLDEERDYRVAVVRELLLGMDHIEPFVRYARAHPERVPAVGSGREAKLMLVDAFSLSLWRSLGGFDAVDANGDGVVTMEEIAAALARAQALPASPITAELVLRAVEHGPAHPMTRAEADAVQTSPPPQTTPHPLETTPPNPLSASGEGEL